MTAAKWDLRAYHETPEHAALAAIEAGVSATPPPPPIVVAREQLSLAVRQEGLQIDLSSVTEEGREAVVVDSSTGDWRPAAEGETPTGHIVHWSCSAHERAFPEDSSLPFEVTAEGVVTAAVEGPLREHGGGARVVHGLGSSVTVSATDASGSPVSYMLASELDPDTVHVEFFPGTAALRIEKDRE